MYLDCMAGIRVCGIWLDGLANIGARTLLSLSIIVVLSRQIVFVLLRLYFTRAFMGHAWLLYVWLGTDRAPGHYWINSLLPRCYILFSQWYGLGSNDHICD